MNQFSVTYRRMFVEVYVLNTYEWVSTGMVLKNIILWNFNTENHTENFRVTLKIHEIAQDKGFE